MNCAANQSPAAPAAMPPMPFGFIAPELVPWNAILNEDGTPQLNEDGSFKLMEA